MSECDFRTSKCGGLGSPGLSSNERKDRVCYEYKVIAYVILVLLYVLVVQLTILTHTVCVLAKISVSGS